VVEYGGSRVLVALAMARYFGEALDDHPSTHVNALFVRFLGWVRWRAE
jgi:hypothetical protein